MAKTHFEKQDMVINQFSNVIRNEAHREKPNALETLIERSRRRTEAYAKQRSKIEAQPRISPKFIHTQS